MRKKQGRPLDGDQPLQPVTVWLPPEVIAWLQQREDGASRTIRKHILAAYRQHKANS